MKSSAIKRANLLLGVAFAGLATVPAYAQTAPQDAPATTDAAGETSGADIVVTGSRLSSPNLTSASPITAVNAQDIRLQGATRIEDVLNALPQVSPSQGSAVSNGSDGTATINLRNLGDRRTLVLINGRRLNPGAPSSSVGGTSAADVNAIPQMLIKRVDVLTGGASSVYGSDAIAGVVNFVLDTDYEGFGVDLNYGVAMHDNRSAYFQQRNRAAGYTAPDGLSVNGHQFDGSVKFGVATDDDRGHLVGYAGYRNIGAIAQNSRDYSNCGFSSNASGFNCSGSPNSFPATFANLRNGDYFGVTASGALNDGNLYNANPLNYYQRPDTRYLGGVIGRYEVSDALKPYFEFNFMDDRTVAQIAPSGLFLGSGSISSINCDNPLLSAALVGRICAADNLVQSGTADAVFLNPNGTPYSRGAVTIGRRGVEGGGRQADYRHTSYRFVLGTKGDLAPGVSYDLSGQYGATTMSLNYRNEYSLTRLTRATDVITDTRPGSSTLGQPVCRSVVDGSDANCVPLNIFNPAITPSQASLNYVLQTGFQTGETKETVITGSITARGADYGVQLPWASEGLGLSIGGEYRREAVQLNVDTAFASGDLTGQGGPTQNISGAFDVKEFFGELQVPIASDRPFFQELTLNGGYRFSHYSTAGSVSSYKGEAVWAPVRDLRFRGGYNRAVRAPNTQELFANQILGLGGSDDPCAGAAPAFTAAQCARTGVTAAQYGNIVANPSEQYQDFAGGNVNLRPERADTITGGVILQPQFIPGLSLSVDYFRIKIKDTIATLGFDTILKQCGLTGDAQLCSFVRRDPGTGSLWLTPNGFINNLATNAGTLQTSGLDVVGSYTLRTSGVGSFGFNFNGTYTDEVRLNRAGADYDCVGLYGGQCGFPQPKWRHQLRVNWTLPDGIGVSARWRFLGATRFERTSADTDLRGSFNPIDARIPSQNYIDLTMTAQVAEKFSFLVGANNLLDRAPPIVSQSAAPISSFGNGNTYPTVYDANGRYVFVGVSLKM
ncbi:MAG: TonB-dependent receptor [Sphingomonas adhaesiva]|uniref:TonB-dependent receptor domain-containing protein n=1 Tax=Sphingomonas adhaesiva TaxID=28212 RepID=UPI002FFCA4AA